MRLFSKFSTDGRTLASGNYDRTIVLWDVTGARTGTPRVEKPSKRELSGWWDALAGDDIPRANEALRSLIQASDAAVTFLKGKLLPAKTIDAKDVTRLVRDLDSDSFETREAASRDLAHFGEQVEPALRKAMRQNPELEAKRRLAEILDQLDNRTLTGDNLREVRAAEVLEHIGTPEAQTLLEALAKGAPQARLTREAESSLKRLKR